MIEQRTLTLDSGIRVRGLVDRMSGIEAVEARWPDDFYVMFHCTTAILDDVPCLEPVLADMRARAERQPGAAWGPWGWTE